MIDLDGVLEYSRILFVETECGDHRPMKLYPNPLVKNNGFVLNVRFFAKTASTELTITDATGQVVKQLNFNAEAEEWNTIQWDVSELAVGMYFLKHVDQRRPIRFVITD